MGGVVQLFNAGIIDQQTVLELLHRGEVLDDAADIDEIVAATELEAQVSLERQVEQTERMAEIGEGTPASDEDE